MYAIIDKNNILQGWLSGAGKATLSESHERRGHRLAILWQRAPGETHQIGDDVSAHIMSHEMIARNHNVSDDACRTLGVIR